MHEIVRSMSPVGFLLMLVIPLVMTIAAVVLGVYAQQSARRRRAAAPGPRGPAEDALGAAITVAIVPFSFVVFMLWARFL